MTSSAANSKAIEPDRSENAKSDDAVAQPVAARMDSQLARLSEAANEIGNLTGQAIYSWDIASDSIEWSRNFNALVGLQPGETRHLKGRSFETMLGSQSRETRFGTILSVNKDTEIEPGTRIDYQCIYVLQPDTESENTPLWIEDTGSWLAGDAGRPVRAEGSLRIINDRRKREEDLRRQSDFDDLTGLPNRRSMERHLEKAIRLAKQSGQVSSFLILSVDRMDLINDIHGFEAGDKVLREIGQIIASKLRADDIVCRFSGAKFGLILRECPPAEIFDAGERLLGAITNKVIQTPSGYVSVSGVIGACFLPHHGETPTAAIHSAFRAARTARDGSSSRISVHQHSPATEAKALKKACFSTSVIEAIEADRIQLAFQPVCQRDGSPAFHEALVRMTDKTGKEYSAGQFISIVEELGLVRLVDKRALELVLKTLATYPDANLSVNVSQDTILDRDWLSTLTAGISRIDNCAGRLIIEVTESMAITQLAETRRFLENVRALGCRIAIDDFGAGFTSFANLKELPVDIVKIDGSFAINLVSSAENQAFIRALIDLTNVFDISTVVEWVEDDMTADILEAWNVDYLQGQNFGMPSTDHPWDLPDTSSEVAK